MAKILLPFNSYTHRAPQVSSRRLVNCYAEQTPVPGKSPLALLRAPGIAFWANTMKTGDIRGMCVHKDELYVVFGEELCLLNQYGAASKVGSIPGRGRVSMASNGYQLIVVANPDAFIYRKATTLAEIATEFVQITDPDFTSRGAAQVAVVDSFAVFIEPNSGRFFHSDLLAAESYDSLNFATAEGAPDGLIGILVDHRELFLFGTDSVEIWYNAGTAGSPFAREQNGFIEVGCGAAYTPVKADNTVFWLDNERVFRRLADLIPQRVSTHALEQRWAAYDSVADAWCFAYLHEGHHFVVLTFPSAPNGGETFVYDIATGEWHERRSVDQSGLDAMWRVAAHAFCYGKNIVGQATLFPGMIPGALGSIESDIYDEFGQMLRMEWTYPSVYAEGRRAFHHRLQIMCQSGTGVVAGQGEAPEIMLSVSDDGGMTFRAVPNRSTGALGQYRTRSTWNRLGSSYDRVYRAAVTDPVACTVWDTQLDVEGGRL